MTQPTVNKDSTKPSRVNAPPVVPNPAVSANTLTTHGNTGPTVATGGSIENYSYKNCSRKLSILNELNEFK